VTTRDVWLLVVLGMVAGAMLGFAFGSGLIYVHVVFR
jgi:uncharacterized membrane protein